MRLDFAFLADAASTADGKLYVLGGGVNQVTAPHFPWPQSLAICFRLVADPDEDVTREQPVRLSIFDPDDKLILGPTTAALTGKSPSPPPSVTNELELAVLVALTINGIMLASNGGHRIEVSIANADATLRFLVAGPDR